MPQHPDGSVIIVQNQTIQDRLATTTAGVRAVREKVYDFNV